MKFSKFSRVASLSVPRSRPSNKVLCLENDFQTDVFKMPHNWLTVSHLVIEWNPARLWQRAGSVFMSCPATKLFLLGNYSLP